MAVSDNEKGGTISLVLGIMSFVCGLSLLTGIPAWLVGNGVLKRHDPSHPQYGLANIGRILGIIATVLGILWVLWVIFFGGLAMLGALAGGASTTVPAH